MAEDPYLPRARALFGSTPNPVSDRAGNVNDFRSEVERRLGPLQDYNRGAGRDIVRENLGQPPRSMYNPEAEANARQTYDRRMAEQRGLLERLRRLFGGTPGVNAERGMAPAGGGGAPPSGGGGPVVPAGGEPAGRPPARVDNVPALREPPSMRLNMPRGSAGGAIGMAPLAVAELARYLQEGPNPMSIGLLPQIPGFSGRAQPAPVSGYSMPETPSEVGPIPEERGRDTGQDYGMRRPPARRAAARPAQTDPRFAAMLARVLGDVPVGPNPYATSIGTPVEAPAPAARPGPGLILDPFMGGGGNR